MEDFDRRQGEPFCRSNTCLLLQAVVRFHTDVSWFCKASPAVRHKSTSPHAALPVLRLQETSDTSLRRTTAQYTEPPSDVLVPTTGLGIWRFSRYSLIPDTHMRLYRVGSMRFNMNDTSYARYFVRYLSKPVARYPVEKSVYGGGSISTEIR